MTEHFPILFLCFSYDVPMIICFFWRHPDSPAQSIMSARYTTMPMIICFITKGSPWFPLTYWSIGGQHGTLDLACFRKSVDNFGRREQVVWLFVCVWGESELQIFFWKMWVNSQKCIAFRIDHGRLACKCKPKSWKMKRKSAYWKPCRKSQKLENRAWWKNAFHEL